MSSSDYYRPAQNQIMTIYTCDSCGKESEIESCYSMSTCTCGGHMSESGESYPSSADDWDEERYPNGEWGPRR